MSKKIKLIIGSTRQGRTGAAIADWLEKTAKSEGYDLEVVDLQKIDLPFYDSAIPPSMSPVDTPEAKNWGSIVSESDGLVVLTAEYNRSVPAPLKNAIDYLVSEWENKPVAVVSYGMVDGGQKVTEHLKDIFGWLKVDFIEPTSAVKLSRSHFNEQQQFIGVEEAMAPAKESYVSALESMNRK